MKDVITQAVRAALVDLRKDHPELDPDAVDIKVDVPNRPEHGDYSTNAAMVVGGLLDIRDRRGLAEYLAGSLRFPEGAIARSVVAGPGFINFFVDERWWQSLVAKVVAEDEAYGRLPVGQGQTVQVEFVSANPTGPLTVGHGRNAVLGDVIARIYEWAGYDVTREYYFNNAGRQMRLLGDSVRVRYLQQLGEEVEFPEEGYQGEYIGEIASGLRAQHGDNLRDAELAVFQDAAEKAIFQQINGTCERLGIEFDSYFNEHTLYTNGGIDAVVDGLGQRDLTYPKDGALWLKGEPLGLDKDPVLVKSSGEPTYRLPDMAYHRDKINRGFDRIVDVFGADHIDTCQEVMAALRALDEPTDHIHVVLYQFVTLQQGGEQVKMSTRKANFVTLDELIEMVGADAVRYFFAMRSPKSHMEFDIDLARSQANENPMYYVQYGHARISSLLRKEAGSLADEPLDLAALEHPAERDLIAKLALLPDVLQRALDEHEPHRLCTYATDIATAFHQFYDRCPVLAAEERRVARARLELARAAHIVLRNVLTMLGVSAPERM